MPWCHFPEISSKSFGNFELRGLRIAHYFGKDSLIEYALRLRICVFITATATHMITYPVILDKCQEVCQCVVEPKFLYVYSMGAARWPFLVFVSFLLERHT